LAVLTNTKINMNQLDLERQARQWLDQLRDAKRSLGELLTVQAPRAAYKLGLTERPKPKRTAPRVAAGVVLGAGVGVGAMYFLEPKHGREHRKKVAQLVG
jgi:hypothetical protein